MAGHNEGGTADEGGVGCGGSAGLNSTTRWDLVKGVAMAQRCFEAGSPLRSTYTSIFILLLKLVFIQST
jgi:hypothetical protein